jgi:hypothetical protein
MPRIPRFGKSADTEQPPTSADQDATPQHDDRSPTAVMSVADMAAQAPPAATAEATPAEPTAATTPAPEGLPAGADPEPEQALGFAERARARRRLRFLRRARELGYRDLGGLVFDLHRYNRERNDLVAAKVHTLSVMDQELRALEVLLKQRRAVTVLHEPGIVACPRCAAIHGTEINFCPNCGLPTGGRPDMPMAVPGGAGATGEWPAVPAAPAAPAEPAAPGEPAPGGESPQAAAAGEGEAAAADAPAPAADGSPPTPAEAEQHEAPNGEIAVQGPVRSLWEGPGAEHDPGATSADDRPLPR